MVPIGPVWAPDVRNKFDFRIQLHTLHLPRSHVALTNISLARPRSRNTAVKYLCLVELSNIFCEIFVNFRPKIIFLALCLGKRGPPCENIDRDLHFAPVVGPFWPLKKNLQHRDLEISKISNIDELDRIYLASPWGLSGGKTEPPDYILMFSSTNVPGITYKINFGIFVLHFWETYLRVPPSPHMLTHANARNLFVNNEVWTLCTVIVYFSIYGKCSYALMLVVMLIRSP